MGSDDDAVIGELAKDNHRLPGTPNWQVQIRTDLVPYKSSAKPPGQVENLNGARLAPFSTGVGQRLLALCLLTPLAPTTERCHGVPKQLGVRLNGLGRVEGQNQPTAGFRYFARPPGL